MTREDRIRWLKRALILALGSGSVWGSYGLARWWGVLCLALGMAVLFLFVLITVWELVNPW